MHPRYALPIALAASFLLALAGCGGDDDDGGAAAPADAGGGDRVVVELHEQNGSGQSGTMTLEPAGDGRTRVVLEVAGGEPSQPAHIHPGSCANLDPAPAYGLPNVVDGRSESTVDASVDELLAGELAVNVHRSDDDLETYVACGDIDGDGGTTSSPGPDY
jgi:hypothetical protein